MCFHGRADFVEMQHTVPFPDTKYVTILRKPEKVMESVYNYYGYYVQGHTFEQFIMDKADRTVKSVEKESPNSIVYHVNYTNSEVSFKGARTPKIKFASSERAL